MAIGASDSGAGEGAEEAVEGQSAFERVAWPAAGVVLAVVLYYALPARGPESVLALQDAIIEGRFEIVRRELDRGVDPNQEDPSGWMPAHYAAFFGRGSMMELLLDAGGDVDARSPLTGQTPLHRAALAGRVDMIELLLSRGATLDALSLRNETPLLIALANRKPGAALTLFEQGAAVRAVEGRTGRTAIHFAAVMGRSGLVDSLLERGARIGARSRTGATPLHDASAGLPGIVRLLLERGADPNARDLFGDTPLFQAARFNCRTCVEQLLAAGARAGVRNYRGETPAGLADEMEHAELGRSLRSAAAREAGA